MLKTVEYTTEEIQSNRNLVVGGDQFPHKIDTNRNMVRLYNHPFCPFAERARLAFLAKGIEHQIVDVDMTDKPEWFVKVGGKVPLLETTEGDLIPESDILVQYAIEFSSEGISLLPKQNIIEAAKIRNYTKKKDEDFIQATYLSSVRGEEEYLIILKGKLEEIESELSSQDDSHPYLFNQKDVTFADIILSPILLRIYYSLVENISTLSFLKIGEYPNIVKYIDNLIHHPILAKGYASQLGYTNYMRQKILDSSTKLHLPFDITPFEDSQSQKEILIKDGLTAKPLKNEKFLRLYGHHLCPFVQRALLVLAAKEIPYQFVAIDLTAKNSWHWKINKGKVPIIEHPDGTIVHDSLDVCEWLQDYTSEGINLFPGGEEGKQKIKETTQVWFKKVVNFILIYVVKESRESGLEEYLQTLEWAESQLPDEDDDGNIFIGGYPHETMTDLMILPFFKDAFALEESQLKETFFDKIDFSKIPKVKKWFDSLSKKYSPFLNENAAYSNFLAKNIEADGPKVQLFYPLV